MSRVSAHGHLNIHITHNLSRVSAHGHLNIHVTHDFGQRGRLPGIKIPYVCIEGATLALTREWALARDTMVVAFCYFSAFTLSVRILDNFNT